MLFWRAKEWSIKEAKAPESSMRRERKSRKTERDREEKFIKVQV
jgi:hypothetical protein